VTLCQSLPQLSVTDSAHRFSADAEHLGKSHPGQVAGSDHPHVGLGELRPRMFFPLESPSPVEGFDGVVLIGPQVKVGRLYADGAVTGVQNGHPIRNGSVEEPVGDTGDIDHSVSAHTELATSLRIGRTGPVPTPLGGRWSLRWFTGHEPSERLKFSKTLRALLLQSTPKEWITMGSPSRVVGPAPISGVDKAITVWDGASHTSILPFGGG
jgi:hypothetical protein